MSSNVGRRFITLWIGLNTRPILCSGVATLFRFYFAFRTLPPPGATSHHCHLSQRGRPYYPTYEQTIKRSTQLLPTTRNL